MCIALTDFWTSSIKKNYTFENYTILSPFFEFIGATVGNNKVMSWNEEVKQHQLYCVVIDNTFFIDFACPQSVREVIDQQLWILSHTHGKFNVEFVCLWEKFNLPTPEQLNEFARRKPDTIVVSEYSKAIVEMSLSTGLEEDSILRNIHLPLENYVDLMCSMLHGTLNNDLVVHYATIIHNHKHGAS